MKLITEIDESVEYLFEEDPEPDAWLKVEPKSDKEPSVYSSTEIFLKRRGDGSVLLGP